jgi:hypothetical protein
MKTRYLTTSMFAAILSLFVATTLVSSVMAQNAQDFSASLSGQNEVPPTESTANGTAKFQVNDDSSEVSFWVNLSGLKQVDAAHIHSGPEGENGEIVVTLAEDEAAEDQDNPEIQLTGNITEDDLQGELEGRQISDLVSLMSNGTAYVNAHTPIYPDGAIRGQIESGAGAAETGELTEAGNASSTETESSSVPDTGNETEEDAGDQ